jgi:hypothetical protein
MGNRDFDRSPHEQTGSRLKGLGKQVASRGEDIDVTAWFNKLRAAFFRE